MKILSVVIVVLLCSCHRQLGQYEKIIKQADKIVVRYRYKGKVKTLSNQELETFKNILVRNINPGMQQKFVTDVNVELSAKDKRIAFLQIYEASPGFVNFNSEKLNFGFRLTYSIGMFIDELENQ